MQASQNAFRANASAVIKKFSWCLYALPMMLAWGVYLLAFYPGIMTPDSLDQWAQANTLQISDHHPPFHTLLIWLFTRIWHSPAAVATAQILFLSLVVAWGLYELNKIGVPAWVSWGISALLAAIPVNGVMVVTLWKDIPYAAALLLLTIQCVKIVFTQGKWLSKTSSWLALAVTCALVSLLRHNGLPVILAVLVCIPIAYWKQWKYTLAATAVFLGLYFGVIGPVYDLFHVTRFTIPISWTLLHHIEAHVASGAKLDAADTAYLNSLLPLSEWNYDCCELNNLTYHPGFNWANLYADNSRNERIALTLFEQDPLVDINHIACVSALAYGIQPQCGMFIHGLNKVGKNLIWISADSNSPADVPQQHSLFPKAASKIYQLIHAIDLNPTWYMLVWRPAIYFYISLLCLGILAFRLRSWRALLIAAPTFLQTAAIAVGTIGQDFRFQYGVYLIGFFALGFLFVPILKRAEKKPAG